MCTQRHRSRTAVDTCKEINAMQVQEEGPTYDDPGGPATFVCLVELLSVFITSPHPTPRALFLAPCACCAHQSYLPTYSCLHLEAFLSLGKRVWPTLLHIVRFFFSPVYACAIAKAINPALAPPLNNPPPGPSNRDRSLFDQSGCLVPWFHGQTSRDEAVLAIEEWEATHRKGRQQRGVFLFRYSDRQVR